MRAAVFTKPFDLSLQDRSVPPIRADELRVQVEACGVCGTDIHIFAGKAPARPPVVLGHEYVGTVVETGVSAAGFKVGDRIAVDPNISCGCCRFCRQGAIHLCLNLHALGVTHDGGFAEYALVPTSQAYLLPADTPASVAAFAEPLSCCLHGIQQAAIHVNKTVVIVGGGAIGLLMLQLARLDGAARVALIEPVASKRQLGKQLGADVALSPDEDHLFQQVEEATGGGADVVVECAGNSDAAEISVALARKGGAVVLFGLAARGDTLNVDLQSAFHRELCIKFSLLNPFTFQSAVDLLVAGRVQVGPLAPVSLQLGDLAAVLSNARQDGAGAIKYQVKPSA